MKKLNKCNVLMLLSLCLGLAACGDDVFVTEFDYQNSDEKLCDKTWQCSRVDEVDGDSIVRQLKFGSAKDAAGFRSGQEILIFYHDVSDKKPYSTTTHHFDWSWMDDSREGLFLDKGAGDISVFHNVLVRNNYLSGNFDSENVVFKRMGK